MAFADFVYSPPQDCPTLIHVDDAIIVTCKPSGLLSVPGKLPGREDSLVSRLQAQFGTVLTAHRLDMDTSGLMVFARNKPALSHLSKQFQARTVKKRYSALCAAPPPGEKGLVDQPLRCDWDRRPLQIIDHELGRPSQTHWHYNGPQTLGDATVHRLTLLPVTGRSHQLRVHMQYLGCPIVGDPFYAPEAVVAMAPRLMLHAAELAFRHPQNDREMAWVDDSAF